jgi:DNA-binding IclR family transcriptional regulator
VDRHDGRYLLGPRLVIGSGTNVTSEQLIRVADPVLQYLVAETGETAVITRRIGLSAVCLHQIESGHPLRVSLQPGSMSPLHAGATGRVLLAYALPEIVEEVIALGLEQLTPATPDESVLRALLAETREVGIAQSVGELISGSVGIAAPIIREQGIVGAVGIIGPEGRCGLAWRARVKRLLPEATRTITAGLAEEAPHLTAPIG